LVRDRNDWLGPLGGYGGIVHSPTHPAKWWKHMGDIMPSNPDNSPVSAPLREVFQLE
jgi:L-rhamnose mutarotase